MKTFAALFLALIFYHKAVQAQSATPGGVAGAILWAKAEMSGKTPVLRAHSAAGEALIPVENGQNLPVPPLFNFNTALYFNGFAKRIDLPLGEGDLSKMTVFTVLQPADSLIEKSVWFFEKNAKSRLLLTTFRMADLDDVRFMNFVESCKDCPVINTYIQFKAADTIPLTGQKLVVGEKPVLPDIPVGSYGGLLAEIIVYDRVLSAEERGQVESYLAVKYGIPLLPATTVSYLNSEAKTVREGKKCGVFYHRIAGIGRDDASALRQNQSASSHEPGLLTIGAGKITADNAANPAVLPDNSYLLWGDDNGPLRMQPKEQGKPRLAGRKWLATAYGAIQKIQTATQLDTRQTDAVLKAGETWWMVIDRSGTGKFAPGDVEYFPAKNITSSEVAVFQELSWDTDHSGSDLFSFGTGPAMMTKFWVTPPRCAPAADGKFHIGAEGGKPPYSFALKATDGSYQTQWTSADNGLTDIVGIGPGDYTLTITDAAGNVYLDSAYIQSADAPVPALNSRYVLMPGQALRLDAAAGMSSEGISYHWSGPDGFQSASPEVRITAPGTYRLTLERDGCSSRQDIAVELFQTDNFRRVELFPNPAPEGNFQIIIDLYRPTKVDIRISDASGRFVLTQTLNGSDRYVHPVRLGVPPGAYVVAVFDGQTSKSFPLIVD